MDEPYCAAQASDDRGRPPRPLATMLRISMTQQWLGYSDPGMAEALHDILKVCRLSKALQSAQTLLLRLPQRLDPRVDSLTVHRYRRYSHGFRENLRTTASRWRRAPFARLPCTPSRFPQRLFSKLDVGNMLMLLLDPPQTLRSWSERRGGAGASSRINGESKC
nr:transposase [Methylococcus sp. Mc7]